MRYADLKRSDGKKSVGRNHLKTPHHQKIQREAAIRSESNEQWPVI
jgi:hypothetical protein